MKSKKSPERRTSPEDASLAGKLLQGSSMATVKSVAGSDLSQRAQAPRKTSALDASLASQLLRDPKTPAAVKRVAASDLAQRAPKGGR